MAILEDACGNLFPITLYHSESTMTNFNACAVFLGTVVGVVCTSAIDQ